MRKDPMLRQCNRLKGYRLGATDGEIGKIEDFYFDDQNWTVRYLVADTGYWLPDRLVLIAPHALKQVDETDKVLRVELTRRQIEESPPITADQPVSRQYERDYYKYYGWPGYWTGPALWGPGPYPLFYPAVPTEPQPPSTAPEAAGDPHLRSAQEITGYHIHAQNGEIGRLEDLIVEDSNWAIRYFVVNTGHWLPGKKVLLAPQWIGSFSWERSTVDADLPLEAIKSAPEYDQKALISRDYEISLFKHYSRQGYWHGEEPLHQNAA